MVRLNLPALGFQQAQPWAPLSLHPAPPLMHAAAPAFPVGRFGDGGSDGNVSAELVDAELLKQGVEECIAHYEIVSAPPHISHPSTTRTQP